MRPTTAPGRIVTARATAGRDPAALLRRAVVALAALFLLPALALASEAGGEAHPRSVQMLVLAFVNFAIYFFLLRRFAWPLVVQYLKDRRAGVVAALEAASRARAEAQAIKQEFEAKLRGIEADAARARAEIVALAETEAKHLLEQARRSADRIRSDARLVADQEVARARRLLQEESAALVAEIAGQVVARNLTSEDQSRFVADFLIDARATAASSAGGAR